MISEEEARGIRSIADVAMVELPLDAEVSFPTADGLEIKELYFPHPGVFMGQHAHAFGHAHIVGSGELRVWVEDEELGDFKAGKSFNIAAGKRHMLMSLKADTRGFCVSRTDVANEIVKRSEFPK